MSIKYKTKITDNYIHFICEGNYNHKDQLDVYKKALDSAKNKGLKAILIDGRKVTGKPPSVMDRYEAGETVAQLQKENHAYIPIAIVGNEPIVDPGRFGETVGINRGAIGKVFTDIKEAINWINEKIK